MNEMSGRPRAVTHIWLAPPSRFLEVNGGHRAGFDGDRPIGVTMPIKARLWRWALPLLLDPAAIGLSTTRESDGRLGKTAVHVVDVGAPDGGFEAHLYFGLRSMRLVTARFTVQAVAEQDSYSDYKRVQGDGLSIMLPFRIRREVQRTRSAVTTEVDVVKYTLNPKSFDEQFR